MGLVRESIAFQRGLDPKTALSVGIRAQISSWLESYKIDKYSIKDDLSIDIFQTVYMGNFIEFMGEFPPYININRCSGDFDIDDLGLTTLRGCPRIVDGYFSCQYNELTNLEGGPIEAGSYYASGNKLVSLNGIAKIIHGVLDVDNNPVEFSVEEIMQDVDLIEDGFVKE